MLDTKRIKVIGFDADDTLWENEMLFRDAETEVASLLEEFEVEHVLKRDMYAMESKNLPAYGYGIKGFVLSMIELAIQVSGGRVSNTVLTEILAIGRRMLEAPLVLLPGVRETLEALHGKYKLVVITKGDLLDQERKLAKSGLLEFFHHTEIVSNKLPADYAKALVRMDILPEEFLMIGNSLRSDVLPVLSLGCQAVHVPYHVTWEHELAEAKEDDLFVELQSVGELLKYFLG